MTMGITMGDTMGKLQLPELGVKSLVVLAAAVIALRSIYLLFLHPLSKYPGPKLWAISRLPWAYHVIKGDVWHAQDKFHDQYGPVVRIGPDELTYLAPEAWKDIYTTKPQLVKDPYSLTPPLNGADSLFTAMGDDHRRIRGAFVNAFSDKALREQSATIESYAAQFTQRLQSELSTSSSGIIDIQPIIGYATFDIISDLTWGESPHALQTPGAHDWITRFFLHAQFSTVRNCLSRFSPLDKLLHYVFLRVTSKQRVANTKLSYERIDRRLAAGVDARSDFMTPLIGKISEDAAVSRKGITKSEVLTNGVAVVIANSQLSTIAITTAVYLLLSHPVRLRRLVDEVRGRFQCEEDIKVAEVQGLRYLNAVIDETLRLHHPTPGNLPRVVPKEGMVVAGRWVPGGTVVGVSLYNVHTRCENFARPMEFHPERFLERGDERFDEAFGEDRREAFQPFSTGPRNCIGAKVFLAEARVLLARLLWKFDLELAEDGAGWLNQKAWLVYEPRGLKVRMTARGE
ncbi:cytochrome P450 [Podospora aff. communis PSN243]|uniref:Cytochrome P450 n=1 Tax=Podospora aff. communis PSN243 TaxID=3040156 RepID=A0AAV9GEM8_9PEZI|nr:cytochrome P450 [Podospora aff. communis PSN243]